MMTNDLETRMGCPCGLSASGIALTWERTPEGLRMRWVLANDQARPANVEIDVARQARPGLAA